MSFASELKTSIINDGHKSSCCRKAFIYGVLFTKAKLVSDEVHFNTESDLYADFLSKYIQEFFGKTAEVSRPSGGGRCRRVSFSSKSASKYLDQIASGVDPVVEKCALCRSSFIRGIFFASGRVCDPAKQYLLEFSPVNYPESLLGIFSELGFEMKLTERRGEPLIYVKKSSTIEDFFAYAALNNAAFEIMNVKIEGELRNNANRIANCETNNIDRAVNATLRQLMVLDALDEANLLSSLPEELERTARMRLKHRDLSIPQLAAISTPPISKSGLTHRLKRITELASQMMPGILK